ncbi:YusW-like protein [Paenibacillus sp. UNC496MF]|uniref:YusW family protein n=1 Tax=Paenibacillus sp. UNC496MF TaxID=1502753 RepID=UPI0008ECF314|nr:YusW family protein [Paenibacillus sp. UNC496MF]SFJ16490.1 YusW-like protein [Paenibacillus sp. UNC496MF]
MKKKISYMLIGALCALMLSYGFVAYADHDSSALAEDRPAASGTYVVPSESDAAAVTPAPAQTRAGEAPIQLEQLKALDIKIAGNNAKIKIELEKEEPKSESKVELKRGDRKQYLTGSEATAFIRQLLAALKLQADMDRQQIADALVKRFAVEPAGVEVKFDIKLKDRPDELKFKAEKDDDDDDAANVQALQATVHPSGKDRLAANNQPTTQAQKKALIARKKALQQAWQKAHKEQQAKKQQQKQRVRGDRDDDHDNGQKHGEDKHDQGEDNDHGGDHGQQHEQDEHDDEDRS